MAFYQEPPELGDTYGRDPWLRSLVARWFARGAREAVEAELSTLGELSGGRLYRRLLAERLDEPRLVQWDPWGRRIDHIELTPLWQEAKVLAARHGLVATAYEPELGPAARLAQFAKVYVLDPSLAVYSCPLAMTDGAARTLLASGHRETIERAVPRLASRDPNLAWTSGQWMTERTGGSDVGLSESVARRDAQGRWRLYGTKWFTSATTSEMALTLARPEGNPPGGSGLALFYLEVRDASGAMNGLRIHRLKDKLGTRMVPTAELELDGALAVPVAGLDGGTRHITPMLGITRTWNAVCAAAGMRRAVMLARDYAARRQAFGARLSEKPLHRETLATLEAETAGATLLAFRVVELLGREEHGVATDQDRALARLLVPLAKLATGKQAVLAASEALECFGGAGYVEDTGLPRLLRDAQVLPIWEGTTNVLSLDVLRALKRTGGVEPLAAEVARCTREAAGVGLEGVGREAAAAVEEAASWLGRAFGEGQARVEAGARLFALTLARAVTAGLLAEHAVAHRGHPEETRFVAAARRFARPGLSMFAQEADADEAAALLAR